MRLDAAHNLAFAHQPSAIRWVIQSCILPNNGALDGITSITWASSGRHRFTGTRCARDLLINCSALFQQTLDGVVLEFQDGLRFQRRSVSRTPVSRSLPHLIVDCNSSFQRNAERSRHGYQMDSAHNADCRRLPVFSSTMAALFQTTPTVECKVSHVIAVDGVSKMQESMFGPDSSHTGNKLGLAFQDNMGSDHHSASGPLQQKANAPTRHWFLSAKQRLVNEIG